MESTTISARINSETLKQLEKLSKATKRSKSFLAAEAIEKYIEEQSWQIQAIKEISLLLLSSTTPRVFT